VKTEIAHLSSHHNILDSHLFPQMSIAGGGWQRRDPRRPADQDEIRGGIRICAVPRHRNRYEHVTVTAFRVVRRAWRERPAVFHFHDPELTP
jgi:hypothetical protein